jgi:hypothetical protein
MRSNSDFIDRPPTRTGPGVMLDVPIDPMATCPAKEVVDGREVPCNRPVHRGRIGCDVHGLSLKTGAEYGRRKESRIKARAATRKAVRDMLRQQFEAGQA